MCIGENKWDLRSRHTFVESVIDTDELIIEEGDEDGVYVEEEPIKDVVIDDYN